MQIYGIHCYLICAYSQSPFRSISVILQEHVYQTEKLLHYLKVTQDSVSQAPGSIEVYYDILVWLNTFGYRGVRLSTFSVITLQMHV
jgi:hypothetical protein